MKKRICLFVIFAMLSVVLAGCGEDQAPNGTTGRREESNSNQTKYETQEGQTGEPTDDQQVKETDFATKSLGDGTCEITDCISEATVIVVPEVLFGETVVGVGSYAFVNMDNLTKLLFPDTLEYVSDYAIGNCEKLEEVELGTGLKRAGQFILNNCPTLESLSFPEGMEGFSDMPIGACANLKEVYIPATVTQINNGISSTAVCPNIVVVTPAGSVAEIEAGIDGIPVKNP